MRKRHVRPLIHPWSPEPASTLTPDNRAALRRLKKRLYMRQWRREHYEQRRVYDRTYYGEHREAILAQNREDWQRPEVREHLRKYWRERERERNNRVPQEIISLQARDHERVVVELRQEGHTFAAIARMTGWSLKSCQDWYQKAVHRDGLPVQRKRAPCDDATLLATYQDGMTWRELARRLGYAQGAHAHRAYLAALDRATRPQPGDS